MFWLPLPDGSVRRHTSLAVAGLAFLAAASPAPHRKELPRIHTHDNDRPAGTLVGHVLRLHLDTRKGLWYPHADDGPSAEMLAFAEAGGPPQIPSPMIRVPAGTEVVASITNSLTDSTLTVHGLVSRPAPTGTSAEPVKVAPGETREVRFRLDAPGAYYYWATTRGRQFRFRAGDDAQLSGAIIVDDPLAPVKPDHVLLITEWADTLDPDDPTPRRLLLAFNGRSWPHTSRLSQRVGDTLRFRLINTTPDVHPMHLHGFYFRVDSRGDGVGDTTYVDAARDSVVTERMRPGATTSITWVPERPGNWLFHCHFTTHFAGRGPLGVGRRFSNRDLNSTHEHNHSLEGMNGLVIGVHVEPRRGTNAGTANAAYARGRHLRLLVRPAGGTEDEPFYAFTLHERGAEPALDTTIRSGRPIVLKRGEPVSIMVVNRTPEPTAVHWHGMELDSYFDGVAGFSGSSNHLSPVIAPRDSFQARFTPPRAGTFIYHTHVDELRQEPAGLAGALIVVEPDRPYDASTDIPVLISTPRNAETARRSVLLNGKLPATPVELRSGVAHRFRLINITITRPGITVRVMRDTSLVQWRALAKDGADLPAAKRVTGRARQQISIGETYDFEVVPEKPGEMQLEVRSAAGVLVGSMPLIVK
jgi:FtsP/CotA-like multicopper oxidase with cupredoxin domain